MDKFFYQQIKIECGELDFDDRVQPLLAVELNKIWESERAIPVYITTYLNSDVYKKRVFNITFMRGETE